MARGRQASRSSITARNKRSLRKLSASSSKDSRSAEEIKLSIDNQWKSFCPNLKSFIIGQDVSLEGLIQFWSQPDNAIYSPMNIGAGTVHLLAYDYLNLGEIDIVHSLIHCGAFLNQLNKGEISMTEMIAMLNKNNLCVGDLPIYSYAVSCVQEGRAESYLRKALPLKYMQALGFETPTSNVPSMRYVDLVANDWSKSSSKKHRSSDHNDHNNAEIKLTLSNKQDGISMEKTIGESSTLKSILGNYSEVCDVSLRSLRFSFNGSTLFLSTIGSKTVKDLGIKDGDVIEVSNVNSTETRENKVQQSSPTSKGKKTEKRKKRVMKAKQSKKGRQTSSVVYNPETDRQRHSRMLTNVLEEMEIQLKSIRQNINDSMLLCQKSKTKKQSSRKNIDSSSNIISNPTMAGLGGKAGKTSYCVNVGRVENLYKTSKRSSASRARIAAKIDLHGCTREEAVSRLNEWECSTMDTAMKGEYPFIVPAVIVCGGGAQVLSEVVEDWIKEKKNVANAPKSRFLSQ